MTINIPPQSHVLKDSTCISAKVSVNHHDDEYYLETLCLSLFFLNTRKPYYEGGDEVSAPAL